MHAYLYEFGPFCLDEREQRLLINGRPVTLTPKAFETLLTLVRNRGRLILKEDLIRAVWPDAFVQDGSLARNISVLRKILDHATDGASCIETIPRRGYRFAADVTVVRERVSPQSEPAKTSLAVLPLKPIDQDSREDYLGLGIADALITKLSTLRQLIVRPTNAVRANVANLRDPIAAARALHVEWVLDGCVQVMDGRIRVTVQLISVRDQSTVWAEKIDEQASDIFAVQDSIAERVAHTVAGRLTSEERTRLIQRGTESLEAHRLYVKGRYYWNRRTEQELRRAIACFNEAIAADPNYALAYAAMADAYTLLGSVSYGSVRPHDVAPKARAAAMRALELDERLSEAVTSLAFVRFRYDWDWSGAERDFRRAIELNPGYATAHQWFAYCLSTMSRHMEALVEIRRARELDPLSLPIATGVGRFLYFARRFDEALAACQQAVDADASFAGAHLDLGMVFEQLCHYDEAISEFTQAVALSGGSPIAVVHLGHAYGRSGRRQEADGVLADLRELSTRMYVAPFDWAVLYMGLGRQRQALGWLEKAYEERSSSLVLLNVEPIFAPVRAESQFRDLLRRVGLAC